MSNNNPTVTWSDGTKIWYSKGVFHRENGPAVIKPDGTELFFLAGKQLTKEDFEKRKTKFMKRSEFTRVVKDVLGDIVHDVCLNDPERAQKAALELFKKGECYSYNAVVIRSYLIEIGGQGWVTWDKE